jgi:hypothetical protein
MKNRKVVSGKNLPMHSPLIASVVLWLVLDKTNAPQWVVGASVALFAIIWIAWIIDTIVRDNVEVFKDQNDTKSK